MKAPSVELIAILTVGIALSGVVLTTTGRLNGRLDGLDARLRTVEQGQSLLIERTGTMDVRLKALEDELASLREEMASLREEQAAHRSELADLAERVAHVEGLLEGIRIALDQRLPPAPE